jgi:hypothetical protein
VGLEAALQNNQKQKTGAEGMVNAENPLIKKAPFNERKVFTPPVR